MESSPSPPTEADDFDTTSGKQQPVQWRLQSQSRRTNTITTLKSLPSIRLCSKQRQSTTLNRVHSLQATPSNTDHISLFHILTERERPPHRKCPQQHPFQTRPPPLPPLRHPYSSTLPLPLRRHDLHHRHIPAHSIHNLIRPCPHHCIRRQPTHALATYHHQDMAHIPPPRCSCYVRHRRDPRMLHRVLRLSHWRRCGAGRHQGPLLRPAHRSLRRRRDPLPHRTRA